MYALGLLKLPVDAQAKEIMLFCIAHCTERGGQKLSHETDYRSQFPIRKLQPDPDPNGQSIPVLQSNQVKRTPQDSISELII